jgi:Na+/proline symporter
MAFPKLAVHQAPAFIGAWCLLGIVAASLSTASGAILAMGTVFSHNIVRQLDTIYPHLVTDDNLLLMARVMTIPFAVTSALLAAYYRETGYLLIVSFDITLATIVAPLVRTDRRSVRLLSRSAILTSRNILLLFSFILEWNSLVAFM